MRLIKSFSINHLKLKSGLYVSRVDGNGNCLVTTFDLRITAPNVEEVMDTGSAHTIEHLGATFLRNSTAQKDIIYFGPMGCRTGFYLVTFGEKSPEDVFKLVLDMCDYILGFSGDIVGATPKECGNYSDQNLQGAKKFVLKYKTELIKYRRFIYEE